MNYEYLSIKQIVEDPNLPDFTIGQIRHYLQNRKSNGLEVAVRKIGKRLYVRRDLLEEWIEKQGSK